MFGDSEITPSSTTPEPSPFPSQPITPPITTPPTPPLPVEPAPMKPFMPPKPKSSILPLLFGFLIVIIAAAAIGVVYYQNKLSVSSSPKPSVTASPSIEPSVEPSTVATSSSSPRGSAKASPSSKASPRASARASSSPVSSSSTPTPTPTPTPISRPTLDIRFGNPSANVKQTIDEGAGDGRVINREYTSIQAGQFDEVPAVWSPKVTICYHFVSNEVIPGKDVKFIFTLDDKADAEASLSQYDKLEAGRLYDWCRDTTTSIGKHTAKLQINSNKSLKEVNYVNNFARLDWENLPDKIAPNYTILGPNNEGASGTCLFPQYISDNVTPYADLKIEQKADSGAWTRFDGNRYCFIGDSGSNHTYTVRITDARGNSNEQNKSFVLY